MLGTGHRHSPQGLGASKARSRFLLVERREDRFGDLVLLGGLTTVLTLQGVCGEVWVARLVHRKELLRRRRFALDSISL